MTNSVRPLAIAPIEDADVAAVIALWQACGLTRPWNDPAADIALARRGPNSTILIGRTDNDIVATAMVGHDGHRGWIYYLAVDPSRQRNDLGTAMTTAAEAWLAEQHEQHEDVEVADGGAHAAEAACGLRIHHALDLLQRCNDFLR